MDPNPTRLQSDDAAGDEGGQGERRHQPFQCVCVCVLSVVAMDRSTNRIASIVGCKEGVWRREQLPKWQSVGDLSLVEPSPLLHTATTRATLTASNRSLLPLILYCTTVWREVPPRPPFRHLCLLPGSAFFCLQRNNRLSRSALHKASLRPTVEGIGTPCTEKGRCAEL